MVQKHAPNVHKISSLIKIFNANKIVYKMNIKIHLQRIVLCVIY
jgi:hypothetical protein